MYKIRGRVEYPSREQTKERAEAQHLILEPVLQGLTNTPDALQSAFQPHILQSPRMIE